MLGGLQKETTRADEPTNYSSSIYYFSDSEPVVTDDEIIEQIGNYTLYHDIHYLSSAQEFRYMLYTGYFWKFLGSYNVTVIIQINSVTLDEDTWTALNECLRRQIPNKYMFITHQHFSSINPLPCPADGFGEFLKKPFQYGNVLYPTTTPNTAILLENGMTDWLEAQTYYNAASLFYNAVTRKLFEYLCFGLDEQSISDFENSFFGTLWEFYADNYLTDHGYDQSFSEITNIDSLLEIWQQYPVDEFWSQNQSDYALHVNNTIKQYFTESEQMSDFVFRNVHLFIHVTNNRYIDLFGIDVAGNAKNYNFANYAALFNFLTIGANTAPITVCGMAAWHITNAFYDLLYAAQTDAKNQPDGFVWNISDVPVYLYEVDNIAWGDISGLEVENCEKTELTDDEREAILAKIDELVGLAP